MYQKVSNSLPPRGKGSIEKIERLEISIPNFPNFGSAYFSKGSFGGSIENFFPPIGGSGGGGVIKWFQLFKKGEFE